MTPASLDVENLTCLRGGRLVFRDVGFSVSAGQVLSLEGPNGVGKTSLLRMIAGFLAPVAGTIRLRSEDGDITDNEERGKFTGWLGHHDAAKPQLTPRETLIFFSHLYGTTGAIDEVLETVGLTRARDLPCQYLSAGQKKRLALARLKLSNRPVWLLDEPLAALDASGKALAADLVKSHCAGGGIVIAATHEPLGLDGARLQLT
jgi:heme exporter protein A